MHTRVFSEQSSSGVTPIGGQQNLLRHAQVSTLIASKHDSNSKVVRMALRPVPQQAQGA
jgi:hypothetical protein